MRVAGEGIHVSAGGEKEVLDALELVLQGV